MRNRFAVLLLFLTAFLSCKAQNECASQFVGTEPLKVITDISGKKHDIECLNPSTGQVTFTSLAAAVAGASGTGAPTSAIKIGAYYQQSDAPKGQQIWYQESNLTWRNGATGAVSAIGSQISSGLLARYPFLDGSGCNISDTSGNGYTAQRGLSGCTTNAPSWTATGLTFTGNQLVTIPTTFWTQTASFVICANVSNLATNGFQTLLSTDNGVGNNAWRLDTTSFRWTYGSWANPIAAQIGMVDGTHCYGWTNGSPQKLWVDGILPFGYIVQNATPTTQVNPASVYLGFDTAGSLQNGSAIYYAEFFNRVLSDDEMAHESAAVKTLVASRGITFSPDSKSSQPRDGAIIVVDGDSIANGYSGIPPSDWSTSFINSLSLGGGAPSLRATYFQNVGLGGYTIAQMTTRDSTNIDTLLTQTTPIVSRAKDKVLIVWAGGNDMVCCMGGNPTSVANSIIAYSQARRLAGWKVVVVTLTSRTVAATYANFETERISVNNLLRTQWFSFADAIADVGADPTIGCNGCATTNPSFFLGDGAHPSSSGYSLALPYIVSAVKSLGIGDVQFNQAVNYVTFAASAQFPVWGNSTFIMTLTGNVTSSNLNNGPPVKGQRYTFILCQDGTGSRTFAWPATVKGGMTIGSTASKCNVQEFMSDGTNLYAMSAGQTNL